MGEDLTMERIRGRILVVRGQRVMLSSDLAELYGVPTKVLVQAVKRNAARFPSDFMFRLTQQEASRLRSRVVTSKPASTEILRSQFVTLRSERAASLRSQFVTLKNGHGRHAKYPPLAFTEHGVTMLSSVLRSKRAVAVNIQVVRAFVHLRQWLITNRQLGERVAALEQTVDGQFKAVWSAIEELITPPERPRKPIGFR